MTKSSLDYSNRLNKIKKQITADLLLVEDTVNIFYLTGLKMSKGSVFIFPDSEYLVVDGRYFENCSKNSPFEVLLDEEKTWKSLFSQAKTVEVIGSCMSFARSHELQEKFGLKLKSTQVLDEVRMIKEPDEILAMQKSSDLLWKGFTHTCNILEEGMSEREVAAEFEFFCKKNGAEALSFDSIIAFGDHSALPHHHCSDRRLERDMTVLMDIGLVFDGYCSDMTRTFSFGQMDPLIHEISDIVERAYQAAFDAVEVGVSCAHLDKLARDVIEQSGYGEAFVHSLGHGVGALVHEIPRLASTSKYKLQENMVFTIEPGIYLPGVGGVRYENMIHLREDGPKSFYPNA